eukprot:3050229-Karenia_brevis.AAC.1
MLPHLNSTWFRGGEVLQAVAWFALFQCAAPVGGCCSTTVALDAAGKIAYSTSVTTGVKEA